MDLDMTARIGSVAYGSLHDGPGQRTVLWFAGCGIRCAGCVNPHLFASDSGLSAPLWEIGHVLLEGIHRRDQGVTFVGGEPFDQPQALAELCEHVAQCWASWPNVPRLIVYSGNTFEQLKARRNPDVERALNTADVLVDGPFVQKWADEDLGYRGSRNQRVIDLAATRSTGEVALLDWDRPRIVIRRDQIISSPSISRRLGLAITSTRHCGELTPEPAAVSA